MNRRLTKVVLALAALVVAGWFGYVFAGPNRHAVIPGQVYRCSQPSDAQITELARTGRVRTVLNLRGHCPGMDWYESQMRACAEAGVNLEDVTMSAKCLPTPAEVRRVIDVFDHADRPILIHCKEGKDRTGLAAAMALLLYTDASLATATRQLAFVYGHFPVGRTVAMDDFFVRYERWLARRNETHSPDRFRDWATNHYVPGVGKAGIAFLTPPTVVKAGTAPAFPVRLTNRSDDDWEFQPGSTAGVQLGYSLWKDGKPVAEGKAGLVRKTVRPGESIDLVVALPPVRQPGEYVFKLYLADYRGAGIPERATLFTKYGDDPAEVSLRVE
jgi:protein tyrosine phosphatase (PTP) superfamily phosphohydrolase (DUF442 family)